MLHRLSARSSPYVMVSAQSLLVDINETKRRGINAQGWEAHHAWDALEGELRSPEAARCKGRRLQAVALDADESGSVLQLPRQTTAVCHTGNSAHGRIIDCDDVM